MKKLLEINDLTMTYTNGTQALKGVSFAVHEGESIAIIGSSGSGKSTLMRCINRLINPTSGSILFENEDITKQKQRELRKTRTNIGMIFQHYNLVYRASVIENVLHGRLGHMNTLQGFLGMYSKQDRIRAVELLEGIGLNDHIYKRADELSGGQKQRVGICRALAQEPKLMLADEPIASLDPKATVDVMRALVDMTQKHNIACIMNLHQVDIAKEFATRIIGIKNGTVFFDGKPEELTEPIIQTLYERELA